MVETESIRIDKNVLSRLLMFLILKTPTGRLYGQIGVTIEKAITEYLDREDERNLMKERQMTEDEWEKAQEEYIKEATRITEEFRKGMNEIKTKYGIP